MWSPATADAALQGFPGASHSQVDPYHLLSYHTNTHGLAFTLICLVPEVCVISALGQVSVPPKSRQINQSCGNDTVNLWVSGQSATTAPSSQTTFLWKSSAGGPPSVGAVVVEVALVLSSTPEDDLLAEQSKGQHQKSEQPLSGATNTRSTPTRHSNLMLCISSRLVLYISASHWLYAFTACETC